MSEDPAGIGPRQSPKPFRNIHLTLELIAIGITDLQVEAKNLLIRGPSQNETHPLGALIMAKYDPDDLTRTQKLTESKLAEQVGKRGGLPDNFDPKSCAAFIAIALLGARPTASMYQKHHGCECIAQGVTKWSGKIRLLEPA
jgi:hypothetical protein